MCRPSYFLQMFPPINHVLYNIWFQIFQKMLVCLSRILPPLYFTLEKMILFFQKQTRSLTSSLNNTSIILPESSVVLNRLSKHPRHFLTEHPTPQSGFGVLWVEIFKLCGYYSTKFNNYLSATTKRYSNKTMCVYKSPSY